MATINKRFTPLEAVHPSELVRDEMRARGIKSKDLAARLGMKAPNLSRFFSAKEDVTPAMAVKLEEALGIPADYWMQLQVSYERDVEDIRRRDEEESQAAQVEAVLKTALNLPLLIKELALDGYRFAKDKLNALYRLFGVDGVDGLLALSNAQGCFKKSEALETETRNLATWILLARHAAASAKDSLPTYTSDGEVTAATAIAAKANDQTLTEADIRILLAEQGIGYCVVPKFEKTPVDAYSTIIDGHPFIVVSHRRNNMDMLAFDVLHECGHINRHLTEGVSYLSYNQDLNGMQGVEQEANTFAMNALIPQQVWRDIVSRGSRSLNIYSLIKVVTDEAKKRGGVCKMASTLRRTWAAWRFKYETGNYKIKGYRSRPIR